MISSDRISKSAGAAYRAVSPGFSARRPRGGGCRPGQGRREQRGFDAHGKGVKRGRRSLEELALCVPEIRTVLQRPDLRNNGLQGVEGHGALLVDEPDFAVGLLDRQLGALLIAEKLIRFPALSAEGSDGGAVGAGEIDGKDSRGGRHGDQQNENGGAEESDATVTAAPATKVLKGGAGTGEDGAALQEALEVNGERARVRVAAMGLLLEALQADRLQVARDFRPEPRRRYRLLGSDLLDRVGGRRSPEGRSAREQFIEDGAQGVLVDRGAGVMDLTAGLLGRHVVGRTDDGAGASQVRVVARGVEPGQSR